MSAAATDVSVDLGLLLRGFFQEKGEKLLDDRRRVFGLLRDFAPAALRATRILMAAYDQGVPSRLAGTVPGELEIGREAGVLSSETGIDPELARTAVETWARALTAYQATVAVADSPPVAAPSIAQPLPPAEEMAAPGALPPVEKLAPTSNGKPPVQALPPVQKLTPAAAAARAAAPSVQPLPPVSPLPGAAPPTGALPTSQPLPASAQTPSAARSNWLLYVLGAVVLLAVVAKGITWLESSNEAPSASSPPSSTPAPAATPTQAPAQGPPAISTNKPFNSYTVSHLENLPNSLALPFGVDVNGEILTYTVAARFEGLAMKGTALINVNRGNDLIATTGVVSGDRFWGKDRELVVSIGGRFSSNASNMPEICAYVRIYPNLLEVRTDDNSFVMVMAQKSNGQCDNDHVIGFGRLQ